MRNKEMVNLMTLNEKITFLLFFIQLKAYLNSGADTYFATKS